MTENNRLIRVGIKLVKKRGTEYLISRDTEVYDMDSGRMLPVKNLRLFVDSASIVTAEVILDVADLVIEVSDD